MPLTVGQLTARLNLDRSGYTTGLADAKGEASKAGDAIAGGIKSGTDRAGLSLRNLASTARTVLPALGIGAILSKGFQRLESIDSAQAKLKGLGHDAGEVKTIMDDALASVKGTAFGLDEAASVAATAVAAGIQPGQQLQSTLKLIADTAAVAGTSLGNMGSIFNKIAANGKLQTETMLQLQDQGIPVLVKLAEHYGITNEAAQKMVTQGKVSFAEFSAVMQDTLGGSALKMGDTIKGTLDNTGAALSRLGAGVLQNVVPLLKGTADGVIVLADGFGKLPGPVRDGAIALGAFLALQKIGLFSGLASGASSLVTQLRLVRTEGLAASGALGAIGKAGAIGLAAAAVGILISKWQEHNALVKTANDLIDTNTGKLVENSRESIKEQFTPYLDALNKAGITLDQVANAITTGGTEGADSVAALNQKLSESQGLFDAIGGIVGASNVDKAIDMLNTMAAGVTTQQGLIQEQLRLSAQAANVAATATRDFIGPLVSEADATARATQAQRDHYNALVNSGAVLGSAATAMGQWIRAQQQAADAARDAAAAQDEANVAYNRATVELVGAQQDAATAMRDAELAAKKSGDAVFDSAGNFNLAQKSVRDMVGSLSTYRDAAVDSINATYQQTKASEGTVAAQQAAQAATNNARQGFIDMAMSMLGVTAPAAAAIANQLGFLQGIRIDDKTFTVTMVRRTVDVAVAEGALGDSWMRRINQDAAAAQQQAASAFTPPSLGDLIGGIPAVKTPKSGGGKGGKSDAEKAAEKAAADAKRAAEKAAADAKRRAEEAARAEQARQEAMVKTITGSLDQIGKAAQKPFDLANMSLSGIVSQMARSERSLANAISLDLDPKKVKPLQDELLGMAREAGKQFQSIQLKIGTKDLAGLRSALTGTVSDVRSAVKTLQDDLRSVGAPSGVIAAITAKEDQLTAAMSDRERVVSQLADAQTSLNNILGQYDQRVQQVTSSMQAYASLTNLVSGTEMDGFGADSLIASMKIRATEAQDFAAGIAKLKSAGLNETTLQQLIDAGPGSAANQVTALVSATSAQIQQINSLATSVFGAGRSLGTLSAESMYRTGISAAQSVVNGLTSQRDSLTRTIEHLADGIEILAQNDMKLQGQRAMDGLIDGLKSKNSALNKAMTGIGAGMLSTFKTALGIHSPSKVMADQVGVPIIDGIMAGMNSRASALDSTGIRIAGGLAGSSVSSPGGPIAGAQGPIELRLTIAGVDGPLADAIAKGARVEVVAASSAAQVRVNQGGSPWPA